GTPLLGLIAVAVMTAISSRVNDTRTAQQLSIWAVVPILGIVLGELFGQFDLTVLVAVIATGILIPLAILLTWGAAQLFQRETILTRWKEECMTCRILGVFLLFANLIGNVQRPNSG